MYFTIPMPSYFKDFLALARVCQQLRDEITASFPKHAQLHVVMGAPWTARNLRPLLLSAAYLKSVRQLFVNSHTELGPTLDYILPIVPGVEYVRITSDRWDGETPLMNLQGSLVHRRVGGEWGCRIGVESCLTAVLEDQKLA